MAWDGEEETNLAQILPWLEAEGFTARWLDGKELRRLEPRFSRQLRGALQIDGAGILESYRYCLALAQAAEKGGAVIRHGEVTSIRIREGRVTGVQIGSEKIACEKVLLAAGPWTGSIGRQLGVDIPVRPLKGQIVRLLLKGDPLTVYFAWHGNYAATKSDGLVWAGTTEEAAGYDERPTPEARDSILASLPRVFPPLGDSEIVQQTACLRPLSGDGLPLIGAVPDLRGSL